MTNIQVKLKHICANQQTATMYENKRECKGTEENEY